MSNSRAIGATPFDVGSNLLLGWFFLAVGMLCNAILWYSLGMGWVAWLMALIGIGFDLAKIRLLNNSAFSFKYSSYLGGTFYFFWFLVLTLLSMFAASGFFLLQITTTQQQAAINGDDYKHQQQRYEIAQKQFDANAAYADVSPSALIAERDKKINAIFSMSVINSNRDPAGTLASTTNSCTNRDTWYYREYGDYCTKIESIRTEYQKKISSAENAQNALVTMEAANTGKALAANDVSAGTPIFSYSSNFLEIAEQNLLLIFVVITAVITELLASILLGSAYLLNKSVRPSIDLIRQVKIAELEMKRELLALQQMPNADKLTANTAGASVKPASVSPFPAQPKQDAEPKRQPSEAVLNGMPAEPKQPKWDAQPIPNGMPSQVEKPLKPTINRCKGNGDTDTTGKHSTRYQFYRESVLKGKLNPTVHAFKQVKHHGKKIGSTTAQEFLGAMVNENLLQKGVDANNRTIYTRVKEACHV